MVGRMETCTNLSSLSLGGPFLEQSHAAPAVWSSLGGGASRRRYCVLGFSVNYIFDDHLADEMVCKQGLGDKAGRIQETGVSDGAWQLASAGGRRNLHC